VKILTAKVVPQDVYQKNRQWIDNYHTELKLINHVQSLKQEEMLA
jgi:hypothetical protein